MAALPANEYPSPPVEDHAPDLYDYDEIATPLASLDAIDEQAIQSFETNGYLAVENVFDQATIDAACMAITNLALTDGDRLVNFEAHVGEDADKLEGEARELAVRKLMSFKGQDQRLDDMLHDKRVLATLETLGCANPEVFQTMALIKGPGGREKPWHQDHAYFNASLDSSIIGVWIALDEATPENGCMRVMPGRMDPVHHWSRRDWQICDTDAKAMADHRVAVPLKPGGALFFKSLLPHGTPTNRSNKRRRALQYHYINSDKTNISTEERLAIFGTEGKDVSC